MARLLFVVFAQREGFPDDVPVLRRGTTVRPPRVGGCGASSSGSDTACGRTRHERGTLIRCRRRPADYSVGRFHCAAGTGIIMKEEEHGRSSVVKLLEGHLAMSYVGVGSCAKEKVPTISFFKFPRTVNGKSD